MFFGGGFGGGGFGGPGFTAFGNGFGGGPSMRFARRHTRESSLRFDAVFTASFGGPGIRVQRFGGQRQRAPDARRQGPELADGRSLFLQLLPLIALLAISVFSSLFSFIATGGGPSTPGFRYAQSRTFNVERSTSRLNVPYFVSPTEWAEHPIGKAAEQANAGSTTNSKEAAQLRSFERIVEQKYEELLYDLCRGEFEHRERRIEQQKGFFGFGADWDKVREIQAEKMPSCEKLNALQLKQKTLKR